MKRFIVLLLFVFGIVAQTILMPVEATPVSPSHIGTASDGFAPGDDRIMNRFSGTAQGDLMISVWHWRSTILNNANIDSIPSGWTQIGTTQTVTSTDLYRYAVFYKVATASEPSSYTWGFSNPQVIIDGYNASFTGVNSSNPIQANNQANGTGATGSLATLNNNTVGAAHFVTAGAQGTSSFVNVTGVTSGYTEVSTARNVQAADNVVDAGGFLHRNLPNGAFGYSFNTGSSDARWAAVGIMINPATVNLQQSTHAWYENLDHNSLFRDTKIYSSTKEAAESIYFDDTNDKLYTLYEQSGKTYISRRDKTGQYDTSFNTTGVRELVNEESDQIGSIVVDEATQEIFVFHESRFGIRRVYKLTSAGALDTTFNGTGFITLGTQTTGILLDQANNFLFVYGGPFSTWVISKYSYTGSLVTAFGSSGTVTSDPTGDGDQLLDVALVGSNLYLTGSQGDDFTSFPDTSWRIEKRSATTGALDGVFGTAGVITSNPTANEDTPFSITSDGSNIYIGGVTRYVQDNDNRIEKRSNLTGALISGFGSGGVRTDTAGSDYTQKIIWENSNLYFLFGNSIVRASATSGATQTTDSDFEYKRIDIINNELNYKTTFALNPTDDEIYAIADPPVEDYRYFIAGREQLTVGSVTTFGENGLLTVNETGHNASANAVSLSDDEQHLFVGGFNTDNGFAGISLYKLNTDDSSLVSGFGTGGQIENGSTGIYDEFITDLAADTSNSNLLVAGYRIDPLHETKIFVQKRNSTSGTVDSGFGTSGTLVVDQLSANDTLEYPTKIIIDPSGSHFYLVNYIGDTNAYTRLEKRRISDGALCTVANCGTEFGTGGVVTLDSATEDKFLDAVIDTVNNQIIIAGLYDQKAHIRSYTLSTGAQGSFAPTDSTVGVGDVPMFTSVSFDSDGFIYLGGARSTTVSANPASFIEKRNSTSGALVTAFGSSGIVSYNSPNITSDEISDLAYSEEQDLLYVTVGSPAESRGLTIDAYLGLNGNTRTVLNIRNGVTGALEPDTLQELTGEEESLPNNDSDYFYFETVDLVPNNSLAVSDVADKFFVSGSVFIDPTFGFDSVNEPAVMTRNSYDGLIPFIGGKLSIDNSAVSTLGAGVPVRIRMGVVSDNSQNNVDPYVYKLQYANKSGTCDTGFSGETYQDVTTTSPFQFHNNTYDEDDKKIPVTNQNPAPSGSSSTIQTFHDGTSTVNIVNPTNPNSDAVFDFSLVENVLDFDEGFCLRLVLSNGSLLDGYITIPTIFNCSNPPVERRLRNGKFFCSEELRPYIWNGIKDF